MKERELGLNYNYDEMKDFFLKHYSDSNSETYINKLKNLNIRHRLKTQRKDNLTKVGSLA